MKASTNNNECNHNNVIIIKCGIMELLDNIFTNNVSLISNKYYDYFQMQCFSDKSYGYLKKTMHDPHIIRQYVSSRIFWRRTQNWKQTCLLLAVLTHYKVEQLVSRASLLVSGALLFHHWVLDSKLNDDQTRSEIYESYLQIFRYSFIYESYLDSDTYFHKNEH